MINEIDFDRLNRDRSLPYTGVMENIYFFDRYSESVREEKVYGDKSLRWTYGTVAGKVSLHALVKRAIFSQWYGWAMDRPKTRAKIAPFVEQFELDENEFAEDVNDYANFNDFFSRKLKTAARPIDSSPESIVFPADGRHLCVPDLSTTDGLFVKGEVFDIHTLLDNKKLASQFARGSLLISRLCPTDYHRFHFPVAGTPKKTRLINGPLYSVNPIALSQNIHILTTNKRTITQLSTASLGTVLLIEVGATCVGSIHQTYDPGHEAEKGDEKGYFRFGGSCTLTLFEPGRVKFADDLVAHSPERREVYAKMGDVAATILPTESV